MSKSASEAAESPPDVPNHRLHRPIGEGSYGKVWLATDAMGIMRAVKVIRRQEIDVGDVGYEREFKAIQRYEPLARRHPSFVPILNVGKDPQDQFFYYSMELADDATSRSQLQIASLTPVEVEAALASYRPRTLRLELRGGRRLPQDECLQYGIALATALEKLHSAKLVHRDVKPENIIFVDGTPKLADVGLVANTGTARTFVGTHRYIPPEGPGEPAADTFALGKVLYEMATGMGVEDFPALPGDFSKWPEEERSPLLEINEVFCTACSPPAERYSSAVELRKDLELLNKNGSVRRMRELEKRDRERQNREAEEAAKRKQRRKKRRTMGAAALGLLLAVGIGAAMRVMRQRERDRATSLDLLKAQVDRNNLPHDCWSITNWMTLQRAAADGFSPNEIKAQAALVLAGFDATRIYSFTNKVGADAAYAPDGRALTAGDGLRHAAIIYPDGRREELPVTSDGRGCWNPDGTPMVFSVERGSAILWNAESGSILGSYALRLGEAVTNQSSSPVLGVSADGKNFAASLYSTQGSRVLVWNKSLAAPPLEIRAEASALGFTPDGSLLAVGGADGVTTVHSIPDLRVVAKLGVPVRANPIQCFAFTRDHLIRASGLVGTNWLLAVGDQGTELAIWDVAAALPRVFCRRSHWELESLAFSPDGSLLASAGRREPRIWDAYTGEMLLQVGYDWVSSDTTALAFSPDGTRLLVGCRTNSGVGSTGVWELQPDRGIKTLRGLNAVVRQIWFSPNSRRIAALTDQWTLAVWDATTDRLLHQFEAPTGILADSAGGVFDADAARFACVAGSTACLYDLNTGHTVARWNLPEGLSDQLRFDGRGRLLLLRRDKIGRELKYRVWRLYELRAGTEPVMLHGQTDFNWPAYDVALLVGAGKFLVSSGGMFPGPRAIEVRDLNTGEILWNITTPPTNTHPGLHVDVGGRWFCYGESPRITRSLDDYREIPGRDADIISMSPSGKEIVRDNWLIRQLDDPEDGIPFAPEWQSSGVRPVFSPDGRYLAWGSAKGVVHVADLPVVKERIGTLVRKKK